MIGYNTHKHHIIPKHMGGTDEPDNLVEVTIEQHAALHKQLWEDLGYWQDELAWKTGAKNMMIRWHFNNCRIKENII